MNILSLLSVSLSLMSFVSLIVFLSQKLSHGFLETLFLFAFCFYVPEKNFFEAGKILNLNVFIFIYLTYFATLLLIYIVYFFYARERDRKNFGLLQPLYMGSLSFLFIILVLQMISYPRHIQQYARRTTEEKISLYFHHSFHFAQYCQKHLPGKHVCRMITDKDTRDPREMLTRAAVRYYLYPLALATRDNPANDCLVIFLKNNPYSVIPDNFVAQKPYDEKSLIAIKP